MSGPNKVYVIDSGNPKNDAAGPVSVKPVSKGEDGKELPKYLQPSEKTARKNNKTPQARQRSQSRTKTRPQTRTQTKGRQSGVPLILSYFAGPLSVLATSRGRESRLWMGISISSVVLGIIVMWIWIGPSDWSTQKNPGGAVTLLMAAAAVIFGFSAWTRAIVLAGQYEGSRLKRMPDWIKGPLAAGLLGIIFPGMGLLVNGRSKQAISALWTACITVISLLFLSRAVWLWNFNLHAGVFAIRPNILEYALISASVAAALGCLVWIVQALNGVRLASLSSNRKTVSRSNWAAVALLISIVAFSALSRPAAVAEALDISAAVASGQGMRIIPLRLSLAAIRLDPSYPGYFVRAIRLYEDCGDQVSADLMRRDLIERLEPSVPLLEKEGIVIAKAGTPVGTTINSSALVDVRSDKVPAVRTMPAELLTLDWDMSRANP